MKHLFYLLWALLPFLGLSQENTTIKVSGRAVHADSSPTYKVTMSLSPAYSSYGSDGMDLEQLKSHYKKALESKGIGWEEIKETPYEFGFETMGYDKEGSVYEFTTTSIEKMRTFLRIKSLGLQRLNTVAVLEIDAKELKKLYEVALKDAKAKAIAIASALDKKIVRILTIEDNQYVGQQVETSIFYDRPVGEYIYSIQVVYEAE
ncbi:SIMPL domain-containing protein [Flagellimonas lutimaris]|uniref:SIMPL domain-containing protein n=1 Tax=Flagellimonas lutimaris TaxID=475082 RepID=UPI003F5CF466